MSNYTYLEAITHIRKYKAFFKLEAIARSININADQFRQIVNRRQYAKELPKKYKPEFIRVITELSQIEQADCDPSQYNTLNEAIDTFFRSNSNEAEPV